MSRIVQCTNLSGHEADHLVGQTVRPGQADELVPVPGDDLRDVEPGQKGDRYDAGKSREESPAALI